LTEPEAQSTELMTQTKDGRERLWSFVASALGTQSDGRRLFVSMAHDSTEQKAYEQRICLLMREVNHRAKNMLSLVRRSPARRPLASLNTLSAALPSASRRSRLIRTC
jgi:two-component sensor histidine kinase